MLKIQPTLTVFALALLLTTGASAETMKSLRGDNDLSAISEKPKKTYSVSAEGGFERSFKDQPPLIPHKSEKYRITLQNNECMKCHSEQNHKKENAPKIGDSHFIDRQDKKLTSVSPRRYFCRQCHVPQLLTGELIDNTHKKSE